MGQSLTRSHAFRQFVYCYLLAASLLCQYSVSTLPKTRSLAVAERPRDTRVTETLNISLSHSRLFKVVRSDTLEQDTRKSLLVFYFAIRGLHELCLYFVPFLRYSSSNTGVLLNSGLGVIQGH